MAISPIWTHRDGLVPTSGLDPSSAGVCHVSTGCKHTFQSSPLPATYMVYVLAGRLTLVWREPSTFASKTRLVEGQPLTHHDMLHAMRLVSRRPLKCLRHRKWWSRRDPTARGMHEHKRSSLSMRGVRGRSLLHHTCTHWARFGRLDLGRIIWKMSS